jgi:putative tryptophan/tyrosine transport system substrate-binding protein
MKRRAFALGLSALAGAMTLPARAQQAGRTFRIGALLGGGRETMQRYRAALVAQLATHGFVEGRNLEVDARGAAGLFHEDREVVREFVTAKRDAIFVCETRATQAAQAATKAIPIVFAWVAEPVASGIVKSYSSPGGNITGVTNRLAELFLKRLELVRELLPKAKRVAVLHYAAASLYSEVVAPSLRKAARQLDLELVEIGEAQWAPAIERAAANGVQAVLPADSFVGTRLSGEQVVETTNRLRLPTVFVNSNMVEAGGLVSIGTNLENDIRRAADLLARVLKGAPAGKQPVDLATQFELVLNLKTARAIGLAVPQSVYLRADRVIE